MKKKTKKRIRKRTQKNRLLKIMIKNKGSFALFSVVLSLLIVIGSTYAWVTYSDEHVNRINQGGNKLSASIKENFKANLSWAPNSVTTKELTVVNDGKMNAFVRVSIFEFFANFKTDMSDGENHRNGGLKIIDKLPAGEQQLAIFEDISTWSTGKYFKIKLDGVDKYIEMSEVKKSDTSQTATAYKYNVGNTVSDKLSYIKINFNDAKIFTSENKPSIGTTNYWYYSNGYFYYSDVLKKNNETEKLVNSVYLSENLPNIYKASFYQLIPVMDAHDVTSSLLNDWGITDSADSYLKKMYDDKLQ